MRSVRLLQALIVTAAMALLLGVLVLVRGPDDEAKERAGLEIVPFQPGGPAGTAHLERRGDRLVGTRAVWGLAPGTLTVHPGPDRRSSAVACGALPDGPRLTAG